MNYQSGDLNIIIISHVNPVIRAAGNEIRILKMINWLRTEGFKIVLLLNVPPLSSDLKIQLLDVVDAVYTPDECPSSIDRKIHNAVKRLFFRQPEPATESGKVRAYLGSPYLMQATGSLCKRFKPCAVIAEYVYTTPCFREVPPGVLKLVDTHDVLSNRNPMESIYCTPEEERAYLLKADVVIAIQSTEAGQFHNLVPERKVVTVGVDFEHVKYCETDDVQKYSVLVVGSDHPANVSGLKAFYENAWPLVWRKCPQAELIIVGKIGKGFLPTEPNVKILGWVENLQDLYRKSAVVISPAIYGTGLKIKTIEALCNGKPLVATPNAVEGLDFEGKAPCKVCDDWPEFANAVISLLESDELRLSLQQTALCYAKENFASRKVYAQLADILRKHLQ